MGKKRPQKNKRAGSNSSAAAQKFTEALVAEQSGLGNADMSLDETMGIVMAVAKNSTPDEDEEGKAQKARDAQRNVEITDGFFSQRSSSESDEDPDPLEGMVGVKGSSPRNGMKNKEYKYNGGEKKQQMSRRTGPNNNNSKSTSRAGGNGGGGRQQKTYGSKERFGANNKNGCNTRSGTRSGGKPSEPATDLTMDDSSSSENENKSNATRSTRRSLDYGNSNNQSSSSPKSNQKKPTNASISILEDLIQQSQFELDHCAYRGMAVLPSERGENENNNDNIRSSSHHSINNPWEVCKYSGPTLGSKQQSNSELILNVDDVAKQDTTGFSLAKAWMEETIQNHCPSGIAWTQESIVKVRQAANKKKKGRKRKSTTSNGEGNNDEENQQQQQQLPDVGQRPEDPKMRCPCDYNPFCTNSLGGVVNELMKESSEQIFSKKKKQYDDLEEMRRVQLEHDRKQTQEQGLSSYSSNNNNNNNSSARLTNNGFFGVLTNSNKKQKKCDSTPPEPMEIIELDCSAPTTDENEVQFIDCQGANNGGDDHDKTDYSAQTAEELGKLRISTMVDSQPIEAYLNQLLNVAQPEDLNDVVCAPRLIEILAKWHESLIFQNPLRDNPPPASSKISIALPPGISNLGATCYLNTQLQCLAQNKAFLNGITSWRAADKNGKRQRASNTTSEADQRSDVMNNVLSKLQSLMAKMVEGSQRSVTTLDFSTALGLENDEQQDPNEFARLLFERMHEAFQQQESLRTLLPSLFEGNTTYYTTCLHCKTVSTRRESFMDLNLPIVALPKEAKGTARKITDFFSKKITGKGTSIPNDNVDTTLQYCLDRYSTVENLDGDNQYFCSKCGCKQDATRETALGSVPPVLNIQLSRYVFDMTTFTKKKLTDKVLLPRRLTVPIRQSDAIGDKCDDRTYILCAVMKHQGTSAYRGHYVAEVQDFLSGQWFEFNDEKVTLLKDGPSCSYMPPPNGSESEDIEMVDVDAPVEPSGGSNGRKKKLVGSAEAYNTYYVEEKFLSKTVLQSFDALEAQLEADKKEASNDDVLHSVARERGSLFMQLGELCLTDARATARVRQRKTKLKEDMLTFKGDSRPTNSSPVWVDAALLRRFVAGDRLEDVFRTPPGEPLLRHKHLLCKHEKGLHPRIARRGKLLTRYMYDRYESMIASERYDFLDGADDKRTKDSKLWWDNINDYHFTSKNMHCPKCVESYREELKKKLDRAKLLKYLYLELDPTDGNRNFIEVSASMHDNLSDTEYDDCAFVVERKPLTTFRKFIETDFLKGLSNFRNSTVNSSSSTTAVPVDVDGDSLINDVNIESISEGLDALDLAMFNFDDTSKCLFDTQLNSGITCPHGNCKTRLALNSGRVRWLRRSVWDALKKVFPKAIEHKLILKGKRKSCAECEQEEASRKDLENKLKDWKTEAFSRNHRKLRELHEDKTGDKLLAKLADFNIQGGKEHDTINIIGNYVPVARSDVVLWRRMVNTVDSMKRNNSDGLTVTNSLKTLLSSRRPDWYKHNSSPLDECFLRKLKCENHGFAFPVFEQDAFSEEGSYQPRGIVLLEEKEYTEFVVSIRDLLKILSSSEGEGEGVSSEDVSTDGVIDLSEEDASTPAHSKPQLLVTIADPPDEPDPNGGDDCESIRYVPVGGKAVYFSCFPRFCDDKDCCRHYVESLEPDDDGKCNKVGETGDDPIVLESDNEDNKDAFSLKVFEVEAGADMDSVLGTLQDLNELPGMPKAPPSDDGPRRSTRRRKAKFPSGPVLSQSSVKTCWNHNQAALRMLLYQTCEDKFKLDHKLTLVFSPPTSLSDQETKDGQQLEPRLKELPFESHKKELKDFCTDGTDDTGLERLSDPSKCLILLMQADKDSSAREDALMDALLESANTISKDDGNGKKKKPAERGFTGTLLSSLGRPAAASEDTASNKSDDKEAGQTRQEKEASPKKKVELPQAEGNVQADGNVAAQVEAASLVENETMQPEGEVKEDTNHLQPAKKKAKNNATERTTRARRKPRNTTQDEDDKKARSGENAVEVKDDDPDWLFEQNQQNQPTQSVLENLENQDAGGDDQATLLNVVEILKESCTNKANRWKCAEWALRENRGKSVDVKTIVNLAADQYWKTNIS